VKKKDTQTAKTLPEKNTTYALHTSASHSFIQISLEQISIVPVSTFFAVCRKISPSEIVRLTNPNSKKQKATATNQSPTEINHEVF
jgi:hypothetical protein